MGYTFTVETLRTMMRGLSPLSLVAILSVLVLLGVSASRVVSLARSDVEATSYTAVPSEVKSADEELLLRQEMALLGVASEGPAPESDNSDYLSLIGPHVAAQLMGEYAGLSESGAFSAEAAQAATVDIAKNLKAVVGYKTYTAADINTEADSSSASLAQYQSDLKVSLEPLTRMSSAEFELYGMYVQTGDEMYLTKLREAAANYREAARLSAAVRVPEAALSYHLAILNSMEYFGSALEHMTEYADDPFASVALLRTYNDAEQKMLFSFNELGQYYKNKLP